MRTLDGMVRMEVTCCVSALISEIAKGYGDGKGTGLADLAVELCDPVLDYEGAALDSDDGIAPIGDGMWQPRGGDRTYASAEEACQDLDIDPYEREVYEHWIVTDWLADRLAERGEKVKKDFYNLCIWARTTTEQSISMDKVIQDIYAATHKTEGAVRDDTLPAFTANVQLLLPVEVTTEGEACDAITGLLTECGIYDGALLDWGYVRGEDGKYTGPREVRIPADYDREEHCVADLVATKVSGA